MLEFLVSSLGREPRALGCVPGSLRRQSEGPKVLFSYRCLDDTGKVRDGRVEADSLSQAQQQLQRKGWKILHVAGLETTAPAQAPVIEPEETIRPRATDSHEPQPEEKGEFLANTWLSRRQKEVRLNLDARALFTLQMAIGLKAGLTLLQALEVQALNEDENVQEVAEKLAFDISSGHTFSGALSKLPDAFSPIYVRMVKSGETSGRLAEVMLALHQRLERMRALQGQITQALAYPAVVFIASLGMVAFLLYAMLPKFLEIFADFGAELPWPTKVLMMVTSDPIFIRMAGVVTLALVVLVFELKLNGRWPVIVGVLKFYTPGVGKIFRNLATADICRSLSMLLYNGVPLLHSLRLLVGATGIPAMDRALERVISNLSDGDPLPLAVADQQEFPSLLRSTLQVAPEVGSLDELLGRVADLLSEDAQLKLATLVSLLEPAVMLLLGLLVGFLVLAVFLPIFKLVTVQL